MADSESTPPLLKLEDVPAYRDEWSRQHPALSLLYHHNIITHLTWCAVACRYFTGGADGEVKIWKSEPAHARSTATAATLQEKSAGGASRPWLIPERHVATLGGPVTGLCVTEKDAGSSEVAVVASTDGTVTLCRTNTGEIVRVLRGARGESLESFRIPAVQSRQLNALTIGRELRMETADTMSRRLAPMSDLAVVRRPVYAINAYRNEVRDVFTGPSNGFFHGLRAVAPTYAHLTPQEETVADVLSGFGVPSALGKEGTVGAAAAGVASSPRQWYASALTLAVAPDTRHGTATATAAPAASVGATAAAAAAAAANAASLRDLYLFLGFPEGLVQVYVLPRRWFQLHLHGETRLDPPCLRFPIMSALLHAGAVLRIDVLASKNLVVSICEDGTTQLRRFSALQEPHRQLGTSVVARPPVAAAPPVLPPLSPQRGGHVAVAAAGGASQGHTRTVTCCCVDATHQLLVTGSADHTLCWWSLMAGSPPIPTRTLSLHDASSNLPDPTADAGQPIVHGGYPIDVSFFYRQPSSGIGERAINDVAGEEGFFVLVLDTEQVVRVFDGITGRLVLVQAKDATLTAGHFTGDARVRHEMQLIRYDSVNGADRFLLGGHSLVPWYFASPRASKAVRGHSEPILFAAWSSALQCMVTADPHHVLLWRVTASSLREAPAVEVVRAWRIPRGVRTVTICSHGGASESNGAAPSLMVALRDQPLLVQYDCLVENPFQGLPGTGAAAAAEAGQLREPLALHRLALQLDEGDTSTTLNTVTALASVSASAPSSALAADESRGDAIRVADGYVCAVCRRGDREGAQGAVLVYPLHDSASSARTSAAAVNSTPELLFPSRHIQASRRRRQASTVVGEMSTDEIVSVLAVPERRLLMLGGRRVLYVTPLYGTTSSACPCALLPAAPVPRQLRKDTTGSAQPASCGVATAIFPGRLVGDDTSVNSPSSATAAGDTASSADGLAAIVASSSASLDGYLSHLVWIDTARSNNIGAAEEESDDNAVGAAAASAPCWILSGSNNGLVQLWDAHAGAEVWHCRVSLSEEPVTALRVHRCASRWVAAVGDQAGMVTLLDITTLLLPQRPATPTSAAAAATFRPPRPRAADDVMMLDRWQAHQEAVSGLSFVEDSAEGEQYQQLLTTGEDAAVVLWTLPLLLPSNGLGCARIGWRLFEQRAGYPLRPNLMPLSWVARETYAKLRERYVRCGLFVKHADLRQSFTACLSQPNAVIPTAESEEALLDRAWSVLVADTQCLLAELKAAGAKSSATPLSETTLREWCVSLSADGVPPQPEREEAVARPQDGQHASAGTGEAVVAGVATLLLAFADRCCDGDLTAKGTSVRPGSANRGPGRPSAVRECLRRAVHAVVQPSAAASDGARRASPGAATTTSKTNAVPAAAAAAATKSPASLALPHSARRSPRPAGQVFAAVATVSALTHSPLPEKFSESVATSASSPAPSPLPVASSVISAAAGVSPASAATDDAPLATATAVPRTSSARQLFAERRRKRSKLRRGLRKDTAAASHTYKVTYSRSAPLVRSTVPDGAVSSARNEGELQTSPLLRRASAQTWQRDSTSTAPERPFAKNSLASKQGEDSGSDDDDGGIGYGGDAPAEVRAAAVVERVHRGRRRRGDALQLLAVAGQANVDAEVAKDIVDAAAENRRLTRESISRYVVVKDSCRTLVENTSPARAVSDGRLTPRAGGATRSEVVPKVAQPVVASTYLTPVLSRVTATADGVRGPTTPSKPKNNANTHSEDDDDDDNDDDEDDGDSVFATQLSWYAMRQRKRDVAQEHARLWNTARVMRTLMGWSSTAAPSEHTSSASDAGQLDVLLVERRQPQRRPGSSVGSSNATSAVAKTPAAPSLVLPRILTSHQSTRDDSITVRAATQVRAVGARVSDGHTASLAALLHVPPTAAIDAAVHPGLPTRATLQRERDAMQTRMRQSVQQRAAQQRMQRVAAQATGNPSALAVADAPADVSRSALMSETLGEAREDGDGNDYASSSYAPRLSQFVSEAAAASNASAAADAAAFGRASISQSSPSRQVQFDVSTLATSTALASSSVSRPKGLPTRQRRVLQLSDGATSRRMATVPLPNATTRRDLFANHSSDAKAM